MEVTVLDDATAVSQLAAQKIIDVVLANPNARIGLATGATQTGVYRALISRYHEGDVSFKGVSFVMLDEYVGLPHTRPNSFRHNLHDAFLNHIDARPDSLEALDGNAADLGAECERFEQRLTEAGGVDIQLLGIGRNGHIGFNEPGSDFSSRTRVVELHPNTIESNSKYFESADVVPRRALSQGIGTILEAKSILLLGLGSPKAQALRDMARAPKTEANPASALQDHASVLVIADVEAAALLDTAML
jgi:glucosamine-6-phosphate deaminase